MKKDPITKRETHIDNSGNISFMYPEHYTNQQRGFTQAGGAKLNFPHSNLNFNPYQIGRGSSKVKTSLTT